MIYTVNYTDDVPDGKAGIAKFWLIKIRPSHIDDVGLLAHELAHVKQFWRFSLFHCIAYGRFNWYTQWCEVRAYKEQLKHCFNDKEKKLNLFAGFIANNHKLSISEQDAKLLLLKGD